MFGKGGEIIVRGSKETVEQAARGTDSLYLLQETL